MKRRSVRQQQNALRRSRPETVRPPLRATERALDPTDATLVVAAMWEDFKALCKKAVGI